jgi:WD40 repeat protein
LYLEVKTTKSSFGTPGLEPFSLHCACRIFGLSTQSVHVLSRHQHKNTIQALAWSPNGDMVASASRDQTVRVFDIRAMKEFRVLKGHKKEVCCKCLYDFFLYIL